MSGAGQVPLSAITTVTIKETPLRIGHLGQFPAATISFNLAPGAALGDAVREIRAAQQEIKLPASFIANFRGASSAFESSLTNEVFLLVAAIVTMYIILGVLYESFIHPITILSTLPSAGVGALLALMLTGCGLDVMGIIGILLLIGIVKKNAIMMVDFALEAERDLWQIAAGSDLRSMPSTVPSDLNDYAGGFVWSVAADAWNGYRI